MSPLPPADTPVRRGPLGRFISRVRRSFARFLFRSARPNVLGPGPISTKDIPIQRYPCNINLFITEQPKDIVENPVAEETTKGCDKNELAKNKTFVKAIHVFRKDEEVLEQEVEEVKKPEALEEQLDQELDLWMKDKLEDMNVHELMQLEEGDIPEMEEDLEEETRNSTSETSEWFCERTY
ncbi:Hypothetical predicted protein [Octopus vulgaris]|uniref:Uncharacterized protein n=1 Tax=Octopus vulgaris TaxID=6645 RepID=A0AA36C1M1_OCTVU|nr:Hypothetical predicted protein [Octopus vulgaris]